MLQLIIVEINMPWISSRSVLPFLCSLAYPPAILCKLLTPFPFTLTFKSTLAATCVSASVNYELLVDGVCVRIYSKFSLSGNSRNSNLVSVTRRWRRMEQQWQAECWCRWPLDWVLVSLHATLSVCKSGLGLSLTASYIVTWWDVENCYSIISFAIL